MADSFFGFDTSASNLNDDEGGGEGSEEEYDALNNETFGHDADEFDWEVEHEHLAHQLESSRRHDGIDDLANSQLEASLSQLVLDETEAPHSTLGSSVWRHDPPPQPPKQHMKNVCTVEELERQLRSQQQTQNQTFFQPRFPVILQRPHGLQGPLPFQQPMNHMNQMNQSLMGQNMGQNNLMNHVNQMGQGQMGQNMNQMGQNVNQMGQNVNQMSQNVSQFMQNNQMGFQNNHGPMLHQNQMMQNQMMNNMNSSNQMSQNHIGQMNHIGHNVNHMGQATHQNNMVQNQIGQNVNQMGQNMSQNVNQNNQMGQSVNQMGQNVNQMGQNVNQMGQNVNQMGQMMNGGQFPMNQFPPMMGQNRMMGPPPGMNMPRQNFSPNMNQFNPNFRGPMPKPNDPMMANQQVMQNQPMHNQNMMPQNQSPQKTKDKLQKSHVFNSKTPNNVTSNLSSQGLVQLIQSTHPMLQPYNNMAVGNSFHNANHHPMLNRTQQFVNQNMMAARDGFTNNRIMANGDDGQCDADEYSGLMTPREKQWLVNIQMLQLNTGTPYIHDFYYTVFLERRQAKKEKEGIKEAHKVNQQNHPFYSGGVKQEPMRRERHNSNRHNSTSEEPPRTYVPTQFENSLGKLQCGSVTAPRKIIDLEVVAGEQQPQRNSRAPSVASTTNPAEAPREVKRTKQLLLDIEALYLILLRLEEMNDPLAISNALILKEREEKQKQLELSLAVEAQEDESNLFLRNIESVQRKKQDSPKSETVDKRQVVSLAPPQKPAPARNLLDEDRDELVNRMFLGLLHGDRLAQVLTVRKGRSLLLRFIRRVPATHGRLRGVWSRIMRALPGAARKYDISSLTPLAGYFARYIENSSGWTAVLETCSLLSEAFDPARTPHALSTSFTLSCVCALIAKAAILVTTAEATGSERQWSKFLKTVARALKHATIPVQPPTRPIGLHLLSQHLKQIDSRGTIEILQRGKPAEFADLTKTDVHEQLIRHLC